MSPELERVREKLYERASITLTDVFDRLVPEDERGKAADEIRALLSPSQEVRNG